MQELDVSRPFEIEKEIDREKTAEVEFIRSFQQYEKTYYLFMLTSEPGNAGPVVTDTYGISIIPNTSTKIRNTPEKPAFSWDKPIRVIETGDICVYKYRSNDDDTTHPWYCVFKCSDGEHYEGTFTDDGREWSHGEPVLENYEPEERYEVKAIDNICWGYDVTKNDFGIARFATEEDAELFKRTKEQSC